MWNLISKQPRALPAKTAAFHAAGIGSYVGLSISVCISVCIARVVGWARPLHGSIGISRPALPHNQLRCAHRAAAHLWERSLEHKPARSCLVHARESMDRATAGATYFERSRWSADVEGGKVRLRRRMKIGYD